MRDTMDEDDFGCDCPACICGLGTPASLINAKLPNFDLDVYHNNDIAKVSLSSYRGRWLILFFYPGDFTFVCPTELQELAVLYPEFKKMNAEVLSVSTDSAYTHKAWHDSSPAIKHVAYPMASDRNGDFSDYMGVYDGDEGTALRGTFIVSPDGLVKSVEVNDNSMGRSAAELLRKLQAAQYVAEHGGEVCPASWKPGSSTLKPGVDLVGKI
jgi:peroxiredoxin